MAERAIDGGTDGSCRRGRTGSHRRDRVCRSIGAEIICHTVACVAVAAGGVGAGDDISGRGRIDARAVLNHTIDIVHRNRRVINNLHTKDAIGRVLEVVRQRNGDLIEHLTARVILGA